MGKNGTRRLIRENRKFKRFIYIIMLMLFVEPIDGQDIYLSRFQSCPQFLNPALTGAFMSNKLKQRVNFYSSFKTMQSFTFNNVSFLAYDRKIKRYGIGGYIMNKSYGPGIFNYVNFNLSGSYKIINDIKNKHNLYTGLQIGGINKYFSNSIRFEDQYDIRTAQFNDNITTSESIESRGIYRIDGALGAFYRYKEPTKRWNPFAGFKIGHAAFPDLSYVNNNNYTPAYIFIQTGTFLNFADKVNDDWIDKSVFRLCPKLYYKYTLDELSYFIGGTSFAYKTKKFSSSSNYNEYMLGVLYNTYFQTISVQLGFKRNQQSHSYFYFSYGMATASQNALTVPVNTIEAGIILKN